MTLKIRRTTILGAGVMGAQIAAHLSAAGVRVHLLYLAAKEDPTDRDPVQPPDETTVGPCFAAVRVPELVQPAIGEFHVFGDPRSRISSTRRRRAAVNHTGEVLVERQPELPPIEHTLHGP